MRFYDSGLMNDALVRDAFTYAQAYTQSLVKERLQSEREYIYADYQPELDILKDMFDCDDMAEKDYAEKKGELESQRAVALKEVTPEAMAAELEEIFEDKSVGAALEIQKYSSAATPALIAAALLAECARDPVDCKKIENQFGVGIGGLIAEILHIEAYPATRDENTAAAAPDTRRLTMASITNAFRLADAIMDDLPPGRAEAAFTEAKMLWGSDSKLDKRFVSVFNRAAEKFSSHYRMETSAAGALELVNNTPRIIPKQTSGKKRTGFGDDGF